MKRRTLTCPSALRASRPRGEANLSFPAQVLSVDGLDVDGNLGRASYLERSLGANLQTCDLTVLIQVKIDLHWSISKRSAIYVVPQAVLILRFEQT
jgi:hypothetical protein